LTLKHVLRIKIRKTNGLSRRPDLKIGIENDNKNQKLIKKAEEKNREVVKIVEEMKKAGVRNLRGKK